MTGLDTTVKGLEVDADQRDPEQWGKLVLTRLPTGEVVHVDPEPYWDGIYYWFRSRGVDPHKWRGQRRSGLDPLSLQGERARVRVLRRLGV